MDRRVMPASKLSWLLLRILRLTWTADLQQMPKANLHKVLGLSAFMQKKGTLPGGNLPNVSSQSPCHQIVLSTNFLRNYLCLWLFTQKGHIVVCF